MNDDKRTDETTRDGEQLVTKSESVGPDRRSVLKAGGLAGVAGVLGEMELVKRVAGQTEPTDAAHTTQAQGGVTADAIDEGFANVVNVVDAGGDPTGNQSVTPVLRNVAADNTLIKFPQGRYKMDGGLRFTGFDKFGMVGTDATIAPTTDDEFSGYYCFKLGVEGDEGGLLLFQGFDYDLTPNNTGEKAIETYVTDSLWASDITINGRHDTPSESGGTFAVTDPSGYGFVERFVFPNGTSAVFNSEGNQKGGRSGITVPYASLGTMCFRDCVINRCHDNGMYTKGGGGKIVVRGGTYTNSCVSNIRIAGRDSEIRNARVSVYKNPSGFYNQTGIRVDGGSNVLLKNVRMKFRQPNGPGIEVYDEVESLNVLDTNIVYSNKPAVGISIAPNTGTTRISNVDITYTDENTGDAAILLKGGGQTADYAYVSDVTVTGPATGDTPFYQEAIVAFRDHTEFRNVTLEQNGPGNRQGITVLGDDCLVADCDLSATLHPLIVQGVNQRVDTNTLESDSGAAGLLITSSAADVDVVKNTVHGGIYDSGATDVVRIANTYPS